jgi:uracil-DNA glycosylase
VQVLPHREIVRFTAKDIYAWSNTPLGKVKVVILGQGEYLRSSPTRVFLFTSVQTLTMAWDKRMVNKHRLINFLALTYVTGLCFSVPAGVKAPPSLRNVRPSYLHFKIFSLIDQRSTRNLRRSTQSLRCPIMGECIVPSLGVN